MNRNPFFSIVMPAYGVEEYIESSVKSLLQQTFADFEIIIVDDCSPDKSGAIADRLQQEDARVQVLHLPKNGGLSNARNQGFKKVTGQYVFFMDSDDTVEADLLEQAHNALLAHPAQVTVFGIQEEYYSQNNVLSDTKEILFDTASHFYTDADSIHKVVMELEKKTLYGYAWNKIFRVDYLREIGVTFRNITLIEDILFNVEVFWQIDSLNVLAITPYHYKKRLNESLTNKFVPQYFELHRKRVQMIYDQHKGWNACSDAVRTDLADIYARYIFSALQRNCDARAKMQHATRKQFLQDLYADKLWQELAPFATLDRSAQGILSRFLVHKQTALCLLAARFIFFVKTKLPMLFAKLK